MFRIWKIAIYTEHNEEIGFENSTLTRQAEGKKDK